MSLQKSLNRKSSSKRSKEQSSTLEQLEMRKFIKSQLSVINSKKPDANLTGSKFFDIE